MFCCIDIDLYILDFLSIREIIIYSNLSTSTKNIFKKSKYYDEISSCIKICKNYSPINICKYGNLRLLEKIDINSYNVDLFMTIKCENGQLDCVKFLIEKGANIMGEHNHAISTAIINGHLNIINYLIEKDINFKYDADALIYASGNGHLEIVNFLIEKGVDVNASDGAALIEATYYNKLTIIQFLVEHGADIRAKNSAALEIAIIKNYYEIVQYLVEKGAYANTQNKLICAICSGNIDIVRLLVETGSDPQANISRAFRKAIEKGYLPIVYYLAEKGANLEEHDHAPTYYAYIRRHYEIVKFLLEKCIDSERRNYYVLPLSHEVEHLDFVKYLFANNAIFRISDAYNRAIINEHFSVVELLIKFDADFKTNGNYALQLAAKYGRLEIIELLVNNGADFRVDGNYALRIAIKYRYSKVIDFLINKGADITNYLCHYCSNLKLPLRLKNKYRGSDNWEQRNCKRRRENRYCDPDNCGKSQISKYESQNT